MKIVGSKSSLWFFIAWLAALVSSSGFAAESKAGLTVRESGIALYSQQDVESAPVARLEKGDELFPLAEAVGSTTWYLVKTPQGLTGWVRAADVTLSDQLKENFKQEQGSIWIARTSHGRTFEGTWGVGPEASADKASGTWTLRDGSGAVAIRGTWSAQKFSTGWSGVWRAFVEGRPGEFTGSWTADLPRPRQARFAVLFEAAAQNAIRGIWNSGSSSGSWSLQAAK
jgi:hypothetical protein